MWEVLNLLFLLVILYVFVRLFTSHVLGMGGNRGGGGGFVGHFMAELALMGLRFTGAVFMWFGRSVVVPLARTLGRAGSRVLERSAARASARAERQHGPRQTEPNDDRNDGR